MFDKAEQEFKDLSEKKRIVANDKQKIHRVRAHCRLLRAELVCGEVFT